MPGAPSVRHRLASEPANGERATWSVRQPQILDALIERNNQTLREMRRRCQTGEDAGQLCEALDGKWVE